MIAVFRFRAEDAYNMDWIERDDFINMLRGNRYCFDYIEQEGITSTLFNEDTEHILGFIRVEEIHDNSCNITMCMSTALQEEFSKDVFKTLRRIVRQATDTYRRVSLCGKASNSKLMKLIKKLGFQEEGIMRKYGWHGEDYKLFSIVR